MAWQSHESLAAELRAVIEERGAVAPEVALVLGSGLGAFADTIDDPVVIEFGELPSMPGSSVPGHAGRFVLGHLDGVPVICQQGRVHLYEGWSAEVVTRAVRSFAQLGVRALVLTNAAGGLTAGLPVPHLMRITDHLNRQGRTSLAPGEERVGVPYDARVAAALDAASRATGVELRSGVYVGLLGPSYETAAEIRMLQALGAQAVGMSTVLEASAAAVCGLAVGAISCITNPGAGIESAPLDHGEVVEAGQAIAADFARLLRAAVPRIRAAVDEPG
ncbi:Purine nucleoside phosphorylase 1 [Planctomycetes bacterium Poly30]|uniref:Purine nucleoside phosphorylase n=2 Tax=Saltatorellus ferox TaxID=2528018 RepID=A0A518EYK5_9BACT|nr:Purine nucleoside phosphorylase 1 [Planctomycetes bacterium Poly30]